MLTCQFLNPAPILEYSMINHLKFLSDNNKEDINSRISNNDKKGLQLINVENDKKDIRPAVIDKQKSGTLN